MTITNAAPAVTAATETPVTREATRLQGVGLYVKTSQWRLEWNSHATGLDCPELIPLWTDETLNQVLLEAASKHIPTWESALADAEPPDKQKKAEDTGHV